MYIQICNDKFIQSKKHKFYETNKSTVKARSNLKKSYC